MGVHVIQFDGRWGINHHVLKRNDSMIENKRTLLAWKLGIK